MSKQSTAPQIHDEHPPSPPEPPQIQTRLRQHAYQWVGIPVIIVIAMLGLVGVFGNTLGRAQQDGGALALDVQYPDRFRFRTQDLIIVQVTNQGDQALDRVRLQFDEAYIASFSNVAFRPNVQSIEDGVYVVELTDLGPGETQQVEVEVQAEKYGRRRGAIRASAGDESVVVRLSTFIFP